MSNIDPGKLFEVQLKKSLESQGYKVTRLPDSNKFGVDTRFTMKNPYDYEIYKYPYNIVLECKSTKESRLSFKRIDVLSKPIKGEGDGTYMIKPHQVRGLWSAAQYEGVYAGIIIEFRSEVYEHYFLPIKNFVLFMNSTTKASINYNEITQLGIRLGNEKKVKNYIISLDNIFKEDLW